MDDISAVAEATKSVADLVKQIDAQPHQRLYLLKIWWIVRNVTRHCIKWGIAPEDAVPTTCGDYPPETQGHILLMVKARIAKLTKK